MFFARRKYQIRTTWMHKTRNNGHVQRGDLNHQQNFFLNRLELSSRIKCKIHTHIKIKTVTSKKKCYWNRMNKTLKSMNNFRTRNEMKNNWKTLREVKREWEKKSLERILPTMNIVKWKGMGAGKMDKCIHSYHLTI